MIYNTWEQRKLGCLGKVVTGNTPKTSEAENWNDDDSGHVWITPSDISSLKTYDSERHLTAEGWGKARQLPEKSVLITSIASIGKNTVNEVPAAFNQQINAIIPKENDADFILNSMINATPRFKAIAGQTATAIINKSTFEKFEITVPKHEEQKSIGQLLNSFDMIITLHQCKDDF
ncbi:restriction endonuclease subunit S [Fructobacillus tropaeoli]|uniref:restriction endonuclease subunit S n=1 Tax=Fructobacillus tropaeoli TaxID=709323 RepID=UPI0027E3DCE4|nr:restriction endonuclease subunit S [Fructobacillus tropaeoli]